MTYTAIGADVDLPLTTAVDISVKKQDKETGRTPNAVQWQGSEYERVDLAGTITLTNYRTEPTEIEVTRNVLGNTGKADNGGTTMMVNVFEDDSYSSSVETPPWWGGYSWPPWWGHFNGVGRITWKLRLSPARARTYLHLALLLAVTSRRPLRKQKMGDRSQQICRPICSG